MAPDSQSATSPAVPSRSNRREPWDSFWSSRLLPGGTGSGSFVVHGAGTTTATVNVTARGQVKLVPSLQTFNTSHVSQQATASEYGYNGKPFIVVPPYFISFSNTSPNFTFKATKGGTSAPLTVKDNDGVGTPLTVNVVAALGIQLNRTYQQHHRSPSGKATHRFLPRKWARRR